MRRYWIIDSSKIQESEVSESESYIEIPKHAILDDEDALEKFKEVFDAGCDSATDELIRGSVSLGENRCLDWEHIKNTL